MSSSRDNNESTEPVFNSSAAAAAASSTAVISSSVASSSTSTASLETLPLEVFREYIAPHLTQHELCMLKAVSRKCCFFVDSTYNPANDKGRSLETHLTHLGAQNAPAKQKAAGLLAATPSAAVSHAAPVPLQCWLSGDLAIRQATGLMANGIPGGSTLQLVDAGKFRLVCHSELTTSQSSLASVLRNPHLNRTTVAFCQDNAQVRAAIDAYQMHFKQMLNSVMIIVTRADLAVDHDALNITGFGHITLSEANSNAHAFAQLLVAEIGNIANAELKQTEPTQSQSKCLMM